MSQPTTSAQDAGQTLTSYPPKPEGATHFQRDYGYQPATVIRWEWSTTFGRWCALVKFEDGSECFTWPKPYPKIAEEPVKPASAPLYGFTVASHSESPAWFHSLEAAARFADACGWKGCEIETTSTADVDSGDIMDTQEIPWTKEPASAPQAITAPATAETSATGRQEAPAVQFTPGPWTEYKGEVRTEAFYRGDQITIADICVSQIDAGEVIANARLIAAAPELLAALNRIQANPNDPRAHRQALDAINKATLSAVG